MKFTYPSGSRPLEGFTIKRGIGAGGFGQVYYATSDAGKEVALKHIQRNLDVELRGVGQCLNLKHPNLVALYDIKRDAGDEGWVVMEYVAGESLKDVIDRNPNGLPLDAVQFWIQGICAGVACLHDHGIVHRDLKPGNIFDDDGICKIGDYGLSKFISVSRRSGQTESVGTFHYMAPEIGQGRYGKEIDIYAIGIILYEMLTGRVPFEGESSQEIIMKHLTAEPDLGGIPQPYAAVIAGALAKDPQARISSVNGLQQRLGIAAAGEGRRRSAAPDVEVIAAGVADSHAELAFGPVEVIPVAEVVDPGDARKRPVLPMAQEIPLAEVVGPAAAPPRPRREPVGQALHDGWCATRDWWNQAPLGSLGKFAILLAAIFLLVTNANWLLPVAVVLALMYLVYRLIWAVVTGSPERHLARVPQASPAGIGHAEHRSRPRRQGPVSPWHRQQMLRKYLGCRSAFELGSELTGSMLMSAFVAAVLGLVMMVVGGRSMQGPIYVWGPFYVWLVVVATAGSWAVLIPAKVWAARDDETGGSTRGPHGEQVLRRFTMLVLGLAVAWSAYGLAGLLMVDLSVGESTRRPLFGGDWPASMFAVNGAPLLPAYLAYFGGIYVVLRWWRQADPLRPTRLSLWTTVVAAGWAWLLQLIWPFPQPWGFMLAMTISMAVQLSAPWFSPPKRAEIQRAMEDA